MVGTGSGQFQIRSVIKHVNDWFREKPNQTGPQWFWLPTR